MLVLMSLPALAGAAGYFHPDDIAASSEAFRAVAEEAAPAFDKAQSALASLGRDLQALELGMGLLGPRAPEALVSWSAETRRTVTGQFLLVQAHVDAVQEGYAQIFGDALQRALDAGDYDATECTSSGMSAMLHRGSTGSCEGDDLNAVLAAAIDADPTLRSELAALHGQPWPEVGLSPQPQAVVPLTGTARYVQLSALGETFIADLLDRRLEDFEDNLSPLEDDLDADSADAIRAAEGIRAAYEAQLAADGEALITAVHAALERGAKRDGTGDVGLCVSPAGLGGCVGVDSTAEIIAVLRADRKLQKAVSGIQSAD